MDNKGYSQRIALIDDDDILRRSLGRVLKRAGYEVLSYGSAAGFLGAIEKEANDIYAVISDYDMEPINGVDMTYILRSSHPYIYSTVPIIGITGDKDNKEKFRQAGINTVLLKPFDTKELSDVLLSVYDTRRLEETV